MKNLRFLLIVFLLAGIQAPAHAQSPEMPGQLIDMGGYNLHFNVMGSGDKTVVIETGTGSWSLHWLSFQQQLAKDFRVITYDRAGYGWSDPSPYARTAKHIAEELQSGLSKLSVEGPYILLGHSYGGMIIKAFAKQFPEEVEALIFADAASEYQFEKLPGAVYQLLIGGKKQFRELGIKARKNELPFQYMPVDSTLNSNYWEAYQISIARASYYEAMYNELDLLPLTYEQVKIEDPFQKPALIVTAGSSFSAFTQVRNLPIDESNEIWMKLQKELLLVSTDSQQKILEGASHDLLLSGFDGLKTAVESFVKGL